MSALSMRKLGQVVLDNETPGNVDYEFNPGAGANGIVRSVSVAPRGGLVDFGCVGGWAAWVKTAIDPWA